MHWNDVAVAGRCQRNQAHIEKRTGDRLIVVKCYSLDRILIYQPDKKKECRKGHCDQQVQKDRSDNSVIRDTTSPEYGLSDHDSQSAGDDQPRAGQYVKME